MSDTREIRPARALVFSNLAHYYNHVIMLLFPTVALIVGTYPLHLFPRPGR